MQREHAPRWWPRRAPDARAEGDRRRARRPRPSTRVDRRAAPGGRPRRGARAHITSSSCAATAAAGPPPGVATTVRPAPARRVARAARHAAPGEARRAGHHQHGARRRTCRRPAPLGGTAATAPRAGEPRRRRAARTADGMPMSRPPRRARRVAAPGVDPQAHHVAVEGHGEVGPHGGALHPAGVGLDPRGHVEGHDRARVGVDPVDRRGRTAPRGAPRAPVPSRASTTTAPAGGADGSSEVSTSMPMPAAIAVIVAPSGVRGARPARREHRAPTSRPRRGGAPRPSRRRRCCRSPRRRRRPAPRAAPSRIARAAARPARSISRIEGIAWSSVARRSASRMAAASKSGVQAGQRRRDGGAGEATAPESSQTAPRPRASASGGLRDRRRRWPSRARG